MLIKPWGGVFCCRVHLQIEMVIVDARSLMSFFLKKYILIMQLRNYYGYYKGVLILSTYVIMVSLIGMLIITDQAGLMVRLALFMGASFGTLMVLINLKIYSSKLSANRARGALWQAFGIPTIWMIWCYLLATMAFKYI